MAEIIGPVLSVVEVAAAKVVPFISKLPKVDDDVLAFDNIVRHYHKRLEFFSYGALSQDPFT